MMTFQESGIVHKQTGGFLLASIRQPVPGRKALVELIAELRRVIPPDAIAGPAIFINHFINSNTEGVEAEVGFPVRQPVHSGQVKTRELPTMEVLAKVHLGPTDSLGTTFRQVFASQNQYGLISDEFCVEVFLEDDDPFGEKVEVQMVRHPWEVLFSAYLGRVLGEAGKTEVTQGAETIFLESSQEERFLWTRAAVERLDMIADDHQKYEILSNCSHVFPAEQIAKLRQVYLTSFEQDQDMLKAVDVVIAFMDADPGWPPDHAHREGRIVFTAKRPRDPDGYVKAANDVERMRAYCYCPIIRNHMDQGMSSTFCYCSAGWERKQWEGMLDAPVKVDVVKSLLKGDPVCQFAIHLPV